MPAGELRVVSLRNELEQPLTRAPWFAATTVSTTATSRAFLARWWLSMAAVTLGACDTEPDKAPPEARSAMDRSRIDTGRVPIDGGSLYYEAAGHMLNLEAAAAFNRELVSFLASPCHPYSTCGRLIR